MQQCGKTHGRCAQVTMMCETLGKSICEPFYTVGGCPKSHAVARSG
jgi:hypothetical protein